MSDEQIDVNRIRAGVRALSKSMLGAQFRAEVAAFIAERQGPFWARGMAHALDIPENKVAAELARFATNGYLTAMPVEAWDRRRLYEPNRGTSEYWDSAQALIRRVARDEGLRVGADADAAMDAYRADVRAHEPRRSPMENR